jgi:hypothetical protein
MSKGLFVAFYGPIYVRIVVVIREIIFFDGEWERRKSWTIEKCNEYALKVVFDITETKSLG